MAANDDPGLLKAGGDSWTSVSALYPGASQDIAFSAVAAVNATPFDATTTCIRVTPVSGSCRIAIGPTPTAVPTDLLVPVNSVEYFCVRPGDALSVIQEGVAGILNVCEMTTIGQ